MLPFLNTLVSLFRRPRPATRRLADLPSRRSRPPAQSNPPARHRYPNASPHWTAPTVPLPRLPQSHSQGKAQRNGYDVRRALGGGAQ